MGRTRNGTEESNPCVLNFPHPPHIAPKYYVELEEERMLIFTRGQSRQRIECLIIFSDPASDAVFPILQKKKLRHRVMTYLRETLH